MNWTRCTIYFMPGRGMPDGSDQLSEVMVSFDDGGWIHVKHLGEMISWPASAVSRVEWYEGAGRDNL